VLIHTGAFVTVKVTPGVIETIVFDNIEVWTSIGTRVTVTSAGHWAAGAGILITADDADAINDRKAVNLDTFLKSMMWKDRRTRTSAEEKPLRLQDAFCPRNLRHGFLKVVH
jgi:hypothetical protein